MTTNQPKQVEHAPASATESEPLQRMLRLVAREVVRQLKIEQTAPKEAATGEGQQ